MIIDLHTHILPPPEAWPDLRERFGYGGWVKVERCDACSARMMIDGRHFRDIGENCWSPRTRIEACEAAGVDMQILSTVPVMFGYWARPRDCLEVSRMLNDHIADVCRDHPGRFHGLGTVPMQDAKLAIRELERCVGPLGFRGIEIGTHIDGDRKSMNLDAPELFDIFAAASELGAAVFVHPWDMMGKDRMPKYWLPWLVGMPAEGALAICSMIFGGVLERLPRLRICFAHGGGSFPYTIGRIQHGFDARPDLCAVDNARPPEEYLGRFYVDSLVHDAESLRFLIGKVGVDRIALGSDYPFPLGEDVPGALIRSMDDLAPAMKERMLGGTAIEFLGLHREAMAKENAPSRDAGFSGESDAPMPHQPPCPLPQGRASR
jgi:aminocarboxymuconate-semialdehyde decarboxylase